MDWFYRQHPDVRTSILALQRMETTPAEPQPPPTLPAGRQTKEDARRILEAHFGRKIG